MGGDVINIEILADGTIKSTTDAISAANHSSAEGFFSVLKKLTGGAMVRKIRGTLGRVHIHADGEVHGGHSH